MKLFTVASIIFLSSYSQAFVMVKATGQTENVVVRGDEGAAGTPGEAGISPNCWSNGDGLPQNGGDGGPGGNGSDGENGPDVLIQYTNLAHVKKILVQSLGGYGGAGGSGGWGGSGCNGGYSGNTGPQGHNGGPGGDGRLFLVNSLETFAHDVKSRTGTVSEYLNNNPTKLFTNVWTPKAGALPLLAAGSRVRQTYYEFAGVVTKNVRVAWNSPKSPDQLKARYTFGLRSDNSVYLSNLASHQTLLDYSLAQTSDGATFTVADFYTEADVFFVRAAVTKENRKNKLNVTEDATLNPQIRTRFAVAVYEVRNGARQPVAHVNIDARRVTATATSASIDLHAMEENELDRYNSSSRKRYIDLIVYRTLNNTTISKTIALAHELK